MDLEVPVYFKSGLMAELSYFLHFLFKGLASPEEWVALKPCPTGNFQKEMVSEYLQFFLPLNFTWRTC